MFGIGATIRVIVLLLYRDRGWRPSADRVDYLFSYSGRRKERSHQLFVCCLLGFRVQGRTGGLPLPEQFEQGEKKSSSRLLIYCYS